MALFDKKTLKSVIFCASLMSAIDGDIDKEEWAVIKSFIKNYWQDEFGEFKRVQKEIISSVKKLLTHPEELKKRTTQLITILGQQLHGKQKEVMLNLVREVMFADRKITEEEEDLLNRFVVIMDIQPELD